MSILAEIQASLKAPKDKKNTSMHYAYRTAEGILRAFKDVAPEGASLTVSDEITFIGDRLFLVATATLFANGKEVVSAKGAAMHALAKKGMDDAQITGACSSYARKYALCGLFAIDDSVDDPDSKDNRRAHEDAEISYARAVTDAQVMIESARDLPDLQKVWGGLTRDVQTDKRVADAKDKRKAELQPPPPAMSETAQLAHDTQAPE